MCGGGAGEEGGTHNSMSTNQSNLGFLRIFPCLIDAHVLEGEDGLASLLDLKTDGLGQKMLQEEEEEETTIRIRII